MSVAQFPTAQNIPVVGQPVTLLAVYIPVTATLRCNCGGDQGALEIVSSAPQTCPSCGTVYNATFNPQNGQIQIMATKPKPEIAS